MSDQILDAAGEIPPVAPQGAEAPQLASGAEAGEGQPSVESRGPVLRLVTDEDDGADPTSNVRPDSEVGVYQFKPALDDRRKHRRFKVARPGKVFRRSTQQYQSLESEDLSYSGALLSVVTMTPYSVGEIVEIGVAMTKSSVVPTKALLQGVVVRTGPIEHGRQRVAVRYIPGTSLQKAA